MEPTGQQTTYQKGDLIPYKGGYARVIDTPVEGFVSIEFNGQQLSIPVDSLATNSCWTIQARIETMETEIAKKEVAQDENLELFSSARKMVDFVQSKIKSLLGGDDVSELSGKEQDEYEAYNNQYIDAKKTQRLACANIMTTSHSLASKYIKLGELEQFAIAMGK